MALAARGGQPSAALPAPRLDRRRRPDRLDGGGPAVHGQLRLHAPGTRGRPRRRSRRCAYEDVSFETTTVSNSKAGTSLQEPAAVIAFPGRRVRNAARFLARHGYGVLLFDRRGEGESEGDPNSSGGAATRTSRRPRVPADATRRRPRAHRRIGLSVGGEMLIEAAAETDALRRSCPKARASAPSARPPSCGRRGSGSCSRRSATDRGDASSRTTARRRTSRPGPPDRTAPVFLIYAEQGQGGEELTATTTPPPGAKGCGDRQQPHRRLRRPAE